MSDRLLAGKRALVTGANSGIGLETARALARLGAVVHVGGRDAAKVAKAVADISKSADGEAVPFVVDLGDLRAVRAAADAWIAAHDRLDILVNNAGIVLNARETTADGYETVLAVNHLGPFLLTEVLLPALEAAPGEARIVNVSSDAHRFAKNGFPFDDPMAEHGWASMRRYGESKLANIYFTRELARRLNPASVTVNAVHPGAVATNLGREGDGGVLGHIIMTLARPFFRSPEKGAETSVWVATGPELRGVSGNYYANLAEASLSDAALDDAAAARLWDLSEQWVAAALAK